MSLGNESEGIKLLKGLVLLGQLKTNGYRSREPVKNHENQDDTDRSMSFN